MLSHGMSVIRHRMALINAISTNCHAMTYSQCRGHYVLLNYSARQLLFDLHLGGVLEIYSDI